MKACVVISSLFLFAIAIPLAAGELRKFELPSERLAPYLTRPISPTTTDARQQETVQPPPQDDQPTPRPWRQQMQDQDQQFQRLLQQLR